MDRYYRSGQMQDQKEKADIAVKGAAAPGHQVDTVLTWQRYAGKYSSPQPLVERRDVIVNEALNRYRGVRIEPEEMPSEAPLFLMFTSGTTGKPKGCQHSTGGYLACVARTSNNIQDLHGACRQRCPAARTREMCRRLRTQRWLRSSEEFGERSNAQGRNSRQRADVERGGLRVREEEGGALSFLRTASAPGWVLSRLGLNWSP